MEKKPFKSKRTMKEEYMYDFSFKEHFEELTEKYSKLKDILKQVIKDLNEGKERQRLLRTEYENLVLEIKEKDFLIERMQSVSEAVLDGYNTLKVKCDLESEAATNASKRATKYFEDNQKLRRSSRHKLEENQIYGSIEFSSLEPNQEESISELDMINNISSELRTEIASLKVQLTKEIEKQNSLKEDFEIVQDLYEKEMKEHNNTKEKLELLQLNYNSHVTASHEPKALEPGEESIYEICDGDDDDDNYNIAAASLKLVAQVDNFKHQINLLNTRIQELEFENRKLRSEDTGSMALPKLPPTTPSPLPPTSFNPIKSLITFIHAGKKSAKPKKESVENPQQKAMSEMISTIKKGQVHLKSTPKTLPPESPKKEDCALGEMKTILSSLKKKDKALVGDACEALQGTKCLKKSYVNQETEKKISISGDIDEELKVLLRKRSLKSITDPSACAMSVAEIKSKSSSDAPGKEKRPISSLSDSVFERENPNDYLMQNKDSYPLYDNVITRQSRNLKDTQVLEISGSLFDGETLNNPLMENKAEYPLYDSVITRKNQNVMDTPVLPRKLSVFYGENRNSPSMENKGECFLYDTVITRRNKNSKDTRMLEQAISNSDSEVES